MSIFYIKDSDGTFQIEAYSPRDARSVVISSGHDLHEVTILDEDMNDVTFTD